MEQVNDTLLNQKPVDVVDEELPPRKRQRTSTVVALTPSLPAVVPLPLRFDSYSRLGPNCTEDRKHRDNMVTMFYDLGNAGGHPWSESIFRLTIHGPSSFPTTKDFSTTLGNTSPLDVKTFANNLGLRHCALEFVDTKKNTVEWEWNNDTEIITMSTWANGMVFHDMEPHTDSNEYSLPLNKRGISVLRDILLRLSESADEVE